MKIHIFQSEQGDCLLVEDKAGQHRILCDGGTPGAMNGSIATALGKWQSAGKSIDLAYVSHIDSDHIGGIAVLLDLMMQWKVHDFHAANGDASPQPDLPRPPPILNIWHNAFRDLIKDNQRDIEDLLAAGAPAFQASQVPDLVRAGHEYAQIATSVREALTVSRLIKPDRLGIALNKLPATPAHSGKLLMVRAGQGTEKIGTLNVSILGPTAKELDNLRDGWNNWLRNTKNRRAAREIRDLYAENLETASLGTRNPVALHDWEGIPSYEDVTAPNVASTVLLVEENNKTLLLTGDNHPDMILAGLADAGHLTGPGNSIHLDVLKYPHHGSEHNYTPAFSKQVSADHYLFCGDGSNTNPESFVVEEMFAARIGPAAKRALSPRAQDRPFKFWFSISPEAQAQGKKRDHMQKLLDWAKTKRQQNPQRFSYHFGKTPFTAFTP